MKKLSAALLILIISTCISFAQTSNKEAKERKKQEQYEQITRLVDAQKFGFVGRKANPQKGRQVDLTTRGNSVVIDGEHAVGDLPYFGRSYSGGYSTSDTGVKFDGQMEGLDIQKNDKKRRITIKFKVRSSDDTYNCTFTISSMETVSLYVNSNKKQGITYTGEIKPLDAE